MKEEIIAIPMDRPCRLCKQEIYVRIYKDADGFYVSETCDCAAKGFPPRKHSCDIPEYAQELKKRIVAATDILKELTKYIG